MTCFIKDNKLQTAQISINVEIKNEEQNKVESEPQKISYVTQTRVAPLTKEYIFNKIKEFMNNDENLAYQLTCYIFDNRPKITSEVLKVPFKKIKCFKRKNFQK